jgi:hypothetical protein
MSEPIPLVDGYHAREVSKEVAMPFCRANTLAVFGPNRGVQTDRLLSEAEKDAAARLHENLGTPLRLDYGVYADDGEMVGWSFGFQESRATFYMCNTGILAAHRRRGLYSALLPVIMKRVTTEGFQLIYSRHALTNNAVIIPKLRAGFIISSIELSDRHGTMVHLRYYTNPGRRQVMDYQCGQAALPDAIKLALEPPDE